MRITAENSTMATALEELTKKSKKIDDLDEDNVIKVNWGSKGDGSKQDIEESSTVEYLSENLKDEYNKNQKAKFLLGRDFSADDKITLSDVLATLNLSEDGRKDLSKEDLLMVTNSHINNTITVENLTMNFPKEKDTDLEPPATITWGNATSTFDSINSKVDSIKVKNAGKDHSQYPFGSRVLELSLFDAKAGNEERDELIGVFYCFNTNGFTEDDHSSPSDDENDYIWFCSVGVPEWTPYDDQPEWMQCETKGSDDEEAAVLDELNKQNAGRPNANVCVFPRKNANLKMRFRMVNLGDSRFNRNSTNEGADYQLGVDKINFKDKDFFKGEDISDQKILKNTLLKKQLAIVGRPQWASDDKVTIEIKEMVVTHEYQNF
jgi:hypothetical protein